MLKRLAPFVFTALALTACQTGGSAAPTQCRVANPGVQLDCREEVGSRVSDCRVVSENPPGCGFGEFALQLSQLGRFEQRSMEDISRADGRIRFTLRYRSVP